MATKEIKLPILKATNLIQKKEDADGYSILTSTIAFRNALKTEKYASYLQYLEKYAETDSLSLNILSTEKPQWG